MTERTRTEARADLERAVDSLSAQLASESSDLSSDLHDGADFDRDAFLLERMAAVTFSAEIRGGLREIYVSPYIEKLLGYTQTEWLSSPILWYERLHRGDRKRWNAEFAKVLATGTTVESTYRFVAKNGEVRWIRGTVSIARDKSGAPRQIHGVAFDVSELMQAKDALDTVNHRLVAEMERTKATNAQLVRANDELRNLAYITAHDLKAPLRGIAHHLEWLEEELRDEYTDLPENVSSHIDKSRARAARLQAMIEGLLRYSRIGLVPPEHETIEPADLVNTIFEDLSDDCGLTMKCRSSVRRMEADRSQLRLVLANLIANARDYHPTPKRGRINVVITPVRDDPELVQFEVIDDGAGIAPENHERIFEMFRSLAKSTGIGLAMVKKAVEHAGGTIELDSAIGEGATFRFTWPRTKEMRL